MQPSYRTISIPIFISSSSTYIYNLPFKHHDPISNESGKITEMLKVLQRCFNMFQTIIYFGVILSTSYIFAGTKEHYDKEMGFN